MHARERMIQERFATHTCADCGWPYAPRSVLVLARRRSTWMVLVTCAQCGRRGIFVVSFPTHADPAHADSAPPIAEPISLDEVDRMHAFLATFDGDFRRAFATPPLAPPSD